MVHHNKEVDFLSPSALPARYATVDGTRNNFYHYPMSSCLTYMAEDGAAFSNPTWVVFCRENVALLAVAWLREGYVTKRLWWPQNCMFAHLRVLRDALNSFPGNHRNVDNFFALLALVQPESIDWAALPEAQRLRT